MKFYIVGAGSVGAYFGARLSRASDVTCVVRSRSSAAKFSSGVEFTGVETGHFTPRVLSWDDISELEPGSMVLVTTKLTQFAEALGEIRKRLKGSTQVVLCQNGLQIAEEAQKFLGAGISVARMLCWFGVRLDGSRIVVAGGNTVEAAGGDPSLMKGLRTGFEAAGFEYHDLKNIPEIEWKKALWNLTCNAMCGIADAQNGRVNDDPHLHRLGDQLIDESLAVAKAMGVSLPSDSRQKVFEACARTAINYNSTVQDLRAGRKTEIPWLNGTVVTLGERLGIPTPTHRFVTEMVYFLEKSADKSGL